jgi:nicotinamidase-related amidase
VHILKSALILLDLQNEMVDPAGKVGAHGLAKAAADRNVLENAAKALAVARAAKITVAHVRLGFKPDYSDCLSQAPRIATLKKNNAAVIGTWGTEFPAAIAPQAGEEIITKQCVNPFFNTGLMDWLKKNEIKRIYLGGVATNLVVEATARAADDAGFVPVVIADLCASPNPAWHTFSIESMLPLFGSVIDLPAFEAAAQAA